MSNLLISLDFELLWGVRDHATRESYGANILGGREAIPRMLDLFGRHGIRATWATVGFLFCESRDELMASLPPEHLRPRYTDQRLSNYSYLGEVGEDEARDPYYFGPSLLNRIAATPGQEIATHTLSHCYCLEDGFTAEAFEADLRAAQEIAKRRGITLSSIVFPRNQYGDEHLTICNRVGITAWRGNQTGWAYRATKGEGQTSTRRALRLADAYAGILGPHGMVPQREAGGADRNGINLPASRFLRPCAGRLAPLYPLHIRTICSEMTRVAKKGESYHLWWHPHNFGRNISENIAGLEKILSHFNRLKEDYGMGSRNMANLA